MKRDIAQRRFWLLELAAILPLLFAPGCFSAASTRGNRESPAVVQYKLTDIGPLPGYQYSRAVALNNQGQILGYSWGIAGQNSADAKGEAFLWRDGAFSDLGHFTPKGLNDRGEVVGDKLLRSQTSPNKLVIAACHYKRSLEFLSLAPDVALSSASAINDKGEIAGKVSILAPPHGRACVWRPSISELEPPPGFISGEAHAINNRDQVVGEAKIASANATSRAIAVLWNHTQGEALAMPAGYVESRASAINDEGVIIGNADNGVYDDSYRQQACIWREGQVKILGKLSKDSSSHAGAINDSGQIVGNAEVSQGDLLHGFLWQNGRMIDLNALVPQRNGWLLGNAVGINNAGQIICTSNRGEAMHAILLSPMTKP